MLASLNTVCAFRGCNGSVGAFKIAENRELGPFLGGISSLHAPRKDVEIAGDSWRLFSRRSIETIMHTSDCFKYDVNSVEYRKADYWRAKSTPDLEREINRVRKVLANIAIYKKQRNPDLKPKSESNARRTLAQLLFLRHQRHLADLRAQQEAKCKLKAETATN